MSCRRPFVALVVAALLSPRPAAADPPAERVALEPSDPPGPSFVSGAGDTIWARQNPRPAASVGLAGALFAGPIDDHDDLMVRGLLTLRIAPIRFLDIGMGFLYGYNTNDNQSPNGVVLGIDWLPTVRVGFDLGKLSLGGAVLGRVRAGVRSGGPNLSATGVGLRFLADYRILPSLAAHANLGVYFDNSSNLLSAADLGLITEAYRFSSEISNATVYLNVALGADYAVNRYLRPFATLALDVPVAGGGSPVFRFTPGLRAVPVKGLAIDLQIPIGAGGGGGVPQVAVYQVGLFVSYSFWPGIKETVVVDRSGPSILGRVLRQTGEPIAGAVITPADATIAPVASDEKGDFKVSGLEGREYALTVRARGFAPAEVRAAPSEKRVDVTLTPGEDLATVRGSITDLDGGPIPEVTITLRSAATRRITRFTGDRQGHFRVTIPGGSYQVIAAAVGYLTMGRSLTVDAGSSVVFDASLRPRPSVAGANLEPSRIWVTQINFASNTEQLDAQSKIVLEEVASILLSHPELELVEIAGHTDERGDQAFNQSLSERRAASVAEFLGTQGVESERLDAKGYGKSQPISSNRTERGRAANRRVEFLIKKQVKVDDQTPAR